MHERSTRSRSPRLETQNAGIVTFVRTGTFGGALTGVADGTAVVKVGIWHLEEAHYDFGQFDLNVTVE